MMYKLKNPCTKSYGSIIGILEYSVKDKWKKPKKTVGNETNPITDEQLNEFIQEYKPEEINLIIKDRKGEYRYVDFAVSDFEV